MGWRTGGISTLRTAWERVKGRPIAGCVLDGGVRLSPTYRLRLENGDRAFFKSTFPGSNAHQKKAHNSELRVYQNLQELINPWAPKFLGEFGLGDWRVTLLEDLGPKTAPPWNPSTTRKVARGLAEFHNSTVGVALPDWLPVLHDRGIMSAQLWQPGILDESLNNLSQLSGVLANDANRWLNKHVPALIESAAVLQSAPKRECLMHLDVRFCQNSGRWVQLAPNPGSGRLISYLAGGCCE